MTLIYQYLQAFPVMTGEMNNDGDLQAQFIHQVTDFMKVKCIAQVGNFKITVL